MTNGCTIYRTIYPTNNAVSSRKLLVAATKTRTPEEVEAAIHAGIEIVGYNYFQEAERIYRLIGNHVKWNMARLSKEIEDVEFIS